MKTIFSLFSKFNFDGSETLCDKRSCLEREMTTKGKTPSSDDDLSPMKIEVGRPIPTSTLPTALSISAPVFSPLVSTENLTLPTLNYTKRLGPPPLIPYDPDAIFGGDSDEDPYDYSDDEGDLCFGFDRSVPCSPTPPSQDQPTTEGLRAWNEERGFFWGRTLFTQLSETDITPSYPYFTPSNPTSLGLAPHGASPSSPPETPEPPLPLSDHEWDYSGTSACETAYTEASCCSCELGEPTVENTAYPPSETPYESPNLSSGDPPPDPPSDPPYPLLDYNELDPLPFIRILTHSRASTTSTPDALKDKRNSTKLMDGIPDVSSLVDMTTLEKSKPPSQSYAATHTLPHACFSSPTSALDPTFPLGTPHTKKTTTSLPGNDSKVTTTPDEQRSPLPTSAPDAQDSSLDSKEGCPIVSWKDGPLLPAAHRQRKPTTMVSRLKRPWLTPPLPTNVAWRGWKRSETPTRRLRPSRQTHLSLDFSLSADERPHRPSTHALRESKQPRIKTTHTPLVKTRWTPRSSARRRLERRSHKSGQESGCKPCITSRPSRRLATDKIAHRIDNYDTNENRHIENRTPTLTSTPHDSYDFLIHAYWEMKAG